MNQINIEDKYRTIKEDIINNISEVFDRENYYTHKYRGDEWNDINVSIDSETDNNKTIQIFLRNNSGYIKDKIVVTKDGYNDNYESNLQSRELTRKLMFENERD